MLVEELTQAFEDKGETCQKHEARREHDFPDL